MVFCPVANPDNGLACQAEGAHVNHHHRTQTTLFIWATPTFVDDKIRTEEARWDDLTKNSGGR